jgi:hypothetical protein
MPTGIPQISPVAGVVPDVLACPQQVAGRVAERAWPAVDKNAGPGRKLEASREAEYLIRHWPARIAAVALVDPAAQVHRRSAAVLDHQVLFVTLWLSCTIRTTPLAAAGAAGICTAPPRIAPASVTTAAGISGATWPAATASA